MHEALGSIPSTAKNLNQSYKQKGALPLECSPSQLCIPWKAANTAGEANVYPVA
jgi:hypothetical protein